MIASLLLVLGVVAQVGLAQVDYLRTRLPVAAASLQLTPVSTPGIEFVKKHVPPGEPILYVTGNHDVVELFSYYQMSYALAPRNAVWWAVAARTTKMVDWWEDASGGAQGIRRLAAADHSRYAVFAGTDVTADLHPVAVWAMQTRFTVVEL